MISLSPLVFQGFAPFTIGSFERSFFSNISNWYGRFGVPFWWPNPQKRGLGEEIMEAILNIYFVYHIVAYMYLSP